LDSPLYLPCFTDLWACIERGPIVSDVGYVVLWCLGNGLGLAVVPPWFCLSARGKIDFSRLICCLTTVERTALELRGGPPFAGGYRARRSWRVPSAAMETGQSRPLAATHSLTFSLPFSLSRATPPSPQTLAATAAPSPPTSLPHRRPMGGAWDWCRLLHGRTNPQRLLASPLSQAHREEHGSVQCGSPRLAPLLPNLAPLPPPPQARRPLPQPRARRAAAPRPRARRRPHGRQGDHLLHLVCR
jgi:hypothetical protein